MAISFGGGPFGGGRGGGVPVIVDGVGAGAVIDQSGQGGVRPPTSPGGQQALSSVMIAPVTTAIQVVTGAVGAYEQYKAGEEAKDIAAQNAEAIRRETAEKTRVMEEENRRRESAARARAAASGLSGASSEIYLNALAESGRLDIDWLRQVGETKESAALSEGQMAYHQARAAMWGSIGATIGNAVSTYSLLR